MATYAERLATLDARQADERARLDREREILERLPAGVEDLDVMVHPHKLWDRIGSVHFNYQRYESIKKGRQPELGDLLIVAAKFPPVLMAKYKDGCTSFRTLDDANAAEEKANARGQEPTINTLAPFWCTFEPASYSGEMSIHFVGQSDLGLIEFKFEFPIYGAVSHAIARVQIRHDGISCSQNDYKPRIASKSLDVDRAVHVLRNAKAEYIRRPDSDDRREPGSLELYWDLCGDIDGDVPQLADLIAALTPALEKAAREKAARA